MKSDRRRVGCVYLLRFPGKTHKMYIGVDGRCPNGLQRYKEHLRAAKNQSGCAVHRAIRKYGHPHRIILARALDYDLLLTLERELIDEFDSYRRGYNSTIGGDDPAFRNPEIVAKVRAALRRPEARVACSIRMRAYWLAHGDKHPLRACPDRNPMRNPDVVAKATAHLTGGRNPSKRPEVRVCRSASMRTSEKSKAHLAALHADPEFQASKLARLAAWRASERGKAQLASLQSIGSPIGNYTRSARTSAKLCIEHAATTDRFLTDPIYRIAVTDALREHADRLAERRYQRFLDRATDDAIGRCGGTNTGTLPTRRAVRAGIRRTSDMVASAINAVFSRAEIAVMADRIAVAGSTILSHHAADPR